MTTKRNMLMVLATLVIGGTVLMGAGSARADVHGRGRGDDRGRPSQNYSQRYDRHDNRGGRDYDYRGRDNDRSGIRFGVVYGSPVPTTVYTTTLTQVWVPDAYATQMQNVLVQPAHWETVTIPAVTETRYPSNGRPYTVIITPAHIQRVWVAGRYETRPVQVPVPGHWETVTQACPVVVPAPQPRTTISIGGIFRF